MTAELGNQHRFTPRGIIAQQITIGVLHMSASSFKSMALSAMFGAAAMVAASTLALADEGKMGADKPGMEHCYGVAKAGKNDCASTGHSCAGQSKKDSDKASWVSVPAGVCAKLAGGSTTKM
jgi:uncharacterized membrane protein